ncbi:MAG: M6 family metalloprotease domain-containing protein [Candidatus Zixiibacteriota bacterium]
MRRAVILWIGLAITLAPAAALAVAPPDATVEMPTHVSDALREISRSYGESGIARRLQEIKRARVDAPEGGLQAGPPPPTWNIPVIMGSYSNNAHIFSSAQFQTNLFGANPTGSMTDYYTEVSYNQFAITGTVYGPYTAAQTQAYYVNGDNGFGSDFPTNVSGFIYSILGVGDPAINFAQYDNDGPDGFPNSGDDDGYVDALVVIFPDGDASGGDSDNFWAHFWYLRYGSGSPYTTNDARTGGGFIQIDAYTIQGGERGNGSTNAIKPIGVYCHEFGHVLGLPDLYDGDNSSFGVGTYCLMGLGSWGAGWSSSTEHRPTHMSPWCKEQLGWLTPIQVIGTMSVEIPPVETNPTVYKLWDDPYRGGRYFLLENRTQTGFDGGIYGEGILIWHCNSETRGGNSVDDFRIVDLEEADGLNQIDSRSSFMDAGDFYPGSTFNTAFNAYSNPTSHDVFGNPTGVSVFYIGLGPGDNASATMTQRELLGYTVAYDNFSWMGGYGYGSPQVTYGAVRFTAPGDGQLVAVQAGVRANNPVGYSVRVFDDMIGGSPSGLNFTTSGSFPSLPVSRLYEIALSSSKNLTIGQAFLIDVGFGPDVYAVPYSDRRPISGNSYFSGDGASYDLMTDFDFLIRARVAAVVDYDNDGIEDHQDNCAQTPNPTQDDLDGDYVGDACDPCTDTDYDGYGNPGFAANTCPADNCPSVGNPQQEDADTDGVGDACDNCPAVDNPDQIDADSDTFGAACDCGDNDPSRYPGAPEIRGDGIDQDCDGFDPCCVGRVGDANYSGDDEPTIGDVTTLIDAKFVTGSCDGILPCLDEADVNQSAVGYAVCDDITIGDITDLIDYLFITGSSLGLPDCL